MGDISSNIPAEILHNIFLRVPINLLVKIRYVCKHWNRVISDPYFAKSCKVGDRKILLPFEPVDVLDENDTITRSMVTLNSSPFWELERGKVVTLVGSYNGIVLLLIQDCRSFYDHTDHMVLYNPLTRESKRISDNSHSICNSNANHVYGFGYGSSTPDDLKIVRFRGCEYSSSSSSTNDNWHTCDVFSTKTNSWTVLENFVPNSNWLNDVGTFANGSLYWITSKYIDQHGTKIVALDVNNMVLSYIPVPWYGLDSRFCRPVLGTLDGFLCIASQSWSGQAKGIEVRIILEEVKDVEMPRWEYSCFSLNLKSYSPISILDDGILLISIRSQELVIYDVFKHSWKVIKIPASPDHYFRRSHCGIEYVESLVSPSTLFN